MKIITRAEAIKAKRGLRITVVKTKTKTKTKTKAKTTAGKK